MPLRDVLAKMGQPTWRSNDKTGIGYPGLMPDVSPGSVAGIIVNNSK